VRERERALERERSEQERLERERAERERARERERDRGNKRNGLSSCNSKTFSWPPRSDDDDNNDGYDHPGLGRVLGASYWGAGEPFRRERTHSPPRRTRAAG
jgi:hypothetical protein